MVSSHEHTLQATGIRTKLDHYIRNTASFDSHLYTDEMSPKTNATFYLIIRICLKKGAVGATAAHDFGYNPAAADAAAHTWESLPWPAGQWDKMTTRFANDAERFWSGKFWLVPKMAYPELQVTSGKQKYQCNAYCRLLIYVKDSAADSHKVITLYNIKRRPGAAFREDSATYIQSTMDEVQVLKDRWGLVYKQRTVFHEVGHVLGLPHIGVTTGMKYKNAAGTSTMCVADDGAPHDRCYEGPKSSDTNSVMGKGSGISAREARPWADRIEEHTGIDTDKWKISLQPVRPKPVK